MTIQNMSSNVGRAATGRKPPRHLLELTNAEEVFDTLRNRLNGAVTCRNCATKYYEIRDVHIRDLDADEPKFYCPKCGDRL